MRSYLIDEITSSDMKKMRGFLQENASSSELDSLFWCRLPQDILSDIQSQHTECQPFAFAIELGDNWIKLEFFVRSLTGMRCSCQDYCTSRQRSFIIDFAHRALENLDIRT